MVEILCVGAVGLRTAISVVIKFETYLASQTLSFHRTDL